MVREARSGVLNTVFLTNLVLAATSTTPGGGPLKPLAYEYHCNTFPMLHTSAWYGVWYMSSPKGVGCGTKCWIVYKIHYFDIYHRRDPATCNIMGWIDHSTHVVRCSGSVRLGIGPGGREWKDTFSNRWDSWFDITFGVEYDVIISWNLNEISPEWREQLLDGHGESGRESWAG